jgi:hypothetical protein
MPTPLMAVLLACAPPPPPPPPPPVESPPKPADVPWQWDYSVPDYSEVEKTRYDVDYVVFARDGDLKGTIARQTREGEVRWTVPLDPADNRALIFADFEGALLVTSWNVTRPGATVSRLDPATGATLWHASVAGAEGPPPDHGFNRVQPWRWEQWFVVYEDESNGRYIEVFDPATGASLYHRSEPAP